MNLSCWIKHWAAVRPGKTAIFFGDAETLSYGEMWARVRKMAALLRHGLGLSRGDRVAFLGYNSPEMLVLLFACARTGMILVPLNWRLAPPEHAFTLNNCGAAALFCEPEFLATADAALPAGRRCRRVAMAGATASWDGLDALLRSVPEDDADEGTLFDAEILVVYTSGTTGRPKGAVLDQRALMFNAMNAVAMHDMTSEDVVLTNLPIFHVGGLNIQTTPALQSGASVILHRRFDTDATMAALQDRKPDLALMVPAMIAALTEHPDWNGADLSATRMIATGGSALPANLRDACLARGLTMVESFGTTETAPLILHQRPDSPKTGGLQGRPALHCEVALMDAAGRPVGSGRRGEITVRGPNVMRRYWNDPDATAAVLKDGWYCTGDVGYVDDEGAYFIDGRIRDMILSGAENIYPGELEGILMECPEIAEAVVIGRDDDRWGEIPVAFVVAAPLSRIGREDVLALFAGRLARYKHPKDVVFVDRLPRNDIGKVEKHRLRTLDRCASGRSPTGAEPRQPALSERSQSPQDG